MEINTFPKPWEPDSLSSIITRMDGKIYCSLAVVFGRMKLMLKKSGVETGEFNFALRAKVRDGQVVLWNWFEDSYAVSQAYHGG